jgi:HK97 family phage major capsid protein
MPKDLTPEQVLAAKEAADAAALETRISEAVTKALASTLAQNQEDDTAAQVLAAPAVQRGAEDDPRSGSQKMGDFLRYMALGKGDPERAAKVAKAQGDSLIHKSLTTTDYTAGGALVPTEFLDDYFEALRPRSPLRNLGAQLVTLENGSATLPGITGGAVATYKEEAKEGNATAVQTGDVRLVEKELICILPVSTSLYKSRSGRNTDMLTRDMLNAMAQAETVQFLNGSGGAATPTGILNQCLAANITAGSGTLLSHVDADIAALLEALMGADVNVTAPAFLTTSAIRNNLAKMRSGDLKAFPGIKDGNLEGVRFDYTNSMPAGYFMFGNFDDVIIGDSETIEVTMSEQAAYHDANGVLRAAFSRNEVVMRLVAKNDIALRHKQSVAAKTGVTYTGL